MNKLVAFTVALSLAATACGSGSPDLSTPEGRARAVSATVSEHLEHELAMLALLERHRVELHEAEAALATYVRHHEEALKRLSAQRQLLETEPLALARALAEQRERHAAAFETRRRLEAERPELMQRPSVRAALAALDDL